MKSYDKAFVTGCDENHEWMLEWFFKNYKKHMKDVPLVFANFGLTPDGLKKVRENVHAVMNLKPFDEEGWFKKPMSMIKCPSKKTIWIDLDCEIRDDISNLFNMLKPNMLNMVEDKPWTMRGQELWHNSGVVGFIDKPTILYDWAKAIRNNPVQGDQEVLHLLLNPITKIKYINDIPNEYNVLRLQVETDGYAGAIKVMHWTGQKGKNKIRAML
tara:strand:+ start:13013 stop:13654 length:642 start_codon:yes stop_codon:yes gene_type:complete